jgi:iron complex outermembrane recepter protein
MAFRSSTMFTFTALALAAAAAAAQETPAAAAAAQTVTITGRNGTSTAQVAGFGDLPLGRLPLSVTSLGGPLLQDAAVNSLADITRLDASLADAYNAAGYWSNFSIRGYTLDPRRNYRRDGLPINAETAIDLGNKQSIEVLKGLTGVQAGTSAPGGLVNLVVKRPVAGLRTATLGWREDRTVEAAVDLSDRSGAHGAFGWRVNAAATTLRPQLQAAEGRSHLLALAGDWRVARGSTLEAEVEWSRQRQRSQAGFSLLGSRLPDPASIDPRTNLNNQPWALPVELEGRTASLRWTQEIHSDLRFTAHAMTQRLRTEDRMAFPFGCSSENDYSRYCSDGSFDVYDFRSEGERRHTDALDLQVSGRVNLGGMAHQLTTGLLISQHDARFNRQAYNWVGTGAIDGSFSTPPDPALTDENTNRDERSTELRLLDSISITPDTSVWLGLRHSRLDRVSQRTDGSRRTDYQQSFTTPWLSLSHAVGSQGLAYVSWGQGIESEVTPNRARYTAPGQPLPALKSRQLEAGYKLRANGLEAAVAVFDTRRPRWADIGACDDDGSCLRRADGEQRHRGIEAEMDWRSGPWNLRASAMLLRARLQGGSDPATRDKRPENVPQRAFKAQAAYNLPALPGLALLAFVSHEGNRAVLPDNSLMAAGWTRLDIGARYAMRLGSGQSITLRAGVDNVTDRRAWRETPYQFGHSYLYPLPRREAHASVSVGF